MSRILLILCCSVAALTSFQEAARGESGDCSSRATLVSISGCRPIGPPPALTCAGPCFGPAVSMPCFTGQQIAGAIMNFGFSCESDAESCCIYVSWPMEQCACKCVNCLPPNWEDRQEPDYCNNGCQFFGVLAIKVNGFCNGERGPGPGADECSWNPA